MYLPCAGTANRLFIDLDVVNPISNLIVLLSIIGCTDVTAYWSMPTTDARISMNLKVLRVLLITC